MIVSPVSRSVADIVADAAVKLSSLEVSVKLMPLSDASDGTSSTPLIVTVSPCVALAVPSDRLRVKLSLWVEDAPSTALSVGIYV